MQKKIFSNTKPVRINKTHNINIRVTEKDYAFIKRRADRSGKNISSYVRDAAMDKRTPQSFMISTNHILLKMQNLINRIKDNHDLTEEELLNLNEMEEEICQI